MFFCSLGGNSAASGKTRKAKTIENTGFQAK
jgi:hypothetical protein